MEIEVNAKKTVSVTRIKTQIKVSDRFSAQFLTAGGDVVKDYDDYVPDFFP